MLPAQSADDLTEVDEIEESYNLINKLGLEDWLARVFLRRVKLNLSLAGPPDELISRLLVPGTDILTTVPGTTYEYLAASA